MKGRAALFAIAVGIVSIEGCQRASADAFASEASRIEETLVGAEGARLVERGVIRRAPMQAAQSWELRAPGEWTQYARWIEGVMTRSYNCSRGDAALSCTRQLPGDTFRLRVEGSSHADGLAIRAELSGGPD